MKNILLKDLDWEEMDYGRFPKAWIQALEKLSSYEEQEKFFFNVLEERKIDIKRTIECLDEDLLFFKAFGLKYKNEFEKVYLEQQQQLEKFYEETNLPDSLHNKINEISKSISSVKKTMDDINSSIKYLDVSNLSRALDVIERFNRMDNNEKELLKMLFVKKGE